MQIIIKKKFNHNELTCIRSNNSLTSLNIGPNTPHHDIAHFVIEMHFPIKKGFYYYVNSGLNLDELNNKDVIQKLDKEIWVSEIMTRNLQSLYSKSSDITQYTTMVNWEAKNLNIENVPEITRESITQCLESFNVLINQWNLLENNESLRLNFESE